jgi:hypothetical protein
MLGLAIRGTVLIGIRSYATVFSLLSGRTSVPEMLNFLYLSQMTLTPFPGQRLSECGLGLL